MRASRITVTALSTLTAVAGFGPLSIAHAAGSAPVYVDSGDSHCQNTAAGSQSVPYCSIGEAAKDGAVGPDSTVIVNGSATSPSDLLISVSGTPGHPVTIEARTGFGWQSDVASISVANQHDLVISGFTVAAYSGSVTVKNSVNVLLDRMTVTNVHPIGTGQDAAIWLNGTTSSTVRDSTVGSVGQGVRLDGGSNGSSVVNTVVTNGGGTGITVADSTSVAITGDTVADNAGTGLDISGSASAGTSVENTVLSHNGQGSTPLDLEVSGLTAGQVSVAHNLLNQGAIGWGPAGFANAAELDHAGYGHADVDGDPAFVRSAAGAAASGLLPDYHLTALSKAIDAADSLAPGQLDTDHDSVSRIDDPLVPDAGSGTHTYDDIGAFEFSPSAQYAFVNTFPGSGPAGYQDVEADVSAGGGWKSPTSYDFDFGDGHQSGPQTSHSATHTYVGGQSYHAAVTITYSDGSTETHDYVAAPMSAAMVQPTLDVAMQQTPLNPWRVQATASSPDNPLAPGTKLYATYTVDFGDNTGAVTASDPYGFWGSAAHDYAKPGTYTVTATATYTNGWKSTVSKQIVLADGFDGFDGFTAISNIAGQDRYATAIAASAKQWQPGSAGAVVLASGTGFADALTGVPLAAQAHGPLLLTDPSRLADATRHEIDRVLGGGSSGKTIYVLGGAKAVSTNVDAQLKAAGYHVVRYGGVDRYATALEVAREVMKASGQVVVASGVNFPDALSAGPLAARKGAAIVLSGDGALDPATAAFVSAHQSITAVGGPAATAVRSAVNLSTKNFQDLHGHDRYETSTIVAAAMDAGTIPSGVGIANGLNFPDALSGGAFEANAGQPLLLTDPLNLSSPVAAQLIGWRGRLPQLTVFGGASAISGNVGDEIITDVSGHWAKP